MQAALSSARAITIGNRFMGTSFAFLRLLAKPGYLCT